MTDNNIHTGARTNIRGLGRGRGLARHKNNPINNGRNVIPANTTTNPNLYPSLLDASSSANDHYHYNEGCVMQIEPSAPEMQGEYLPDYSQISNSSYIYKGGVNYQMAMDNFSQNSEDYPCDRSTISNISSDLPSGENVNYSELFENNIEKACLAIQNSVHKMKIDLDKISEAKINQISLYAKQQRERVEDLTKTKRRMCQSKILISRSASHKAVDEASEELGKREEELKKEIMDIIEIKIIYNDYQRIIKELSNAINDYIQVDVPILPEEEILTPQNSYKETKLFEYEKEILASYDTTDKSMKKSKENVPLLDAERNITVNVKKGKGKCEMNKCMGIAIDQTDGIDDIYVCDAGNNRIQVYKRNGQHIRSIIIKNTQSPYNIAVNSTHIFITCHYYKSDHVHLSCKEKSDTNGIHKIIELDTIQQISIDATQTEVFLVENGKVKAYSADMQNRLIEHIKLKDITYYVKIIDNFIFLLGLDGKKFSVCQYNLNGGDCILNFKIENLNSPSNFCIDREGSMFFIDNNRIVERRGIQRREFKETIQHSTALTLKGPKSISIDSRGIIVVCDDKNDWIIQELK